MKYYLVKCRLKYNEETEVEYFECKYMNGVKVFWEYFKHSTQEGEYIPTVIERLLTSELN
jgi:hypothetical protein